MRVAAEEEMNVCAGLFMKGAESPIPLIGVRATVDIVGRGAKVRIAQAFRNVEMSPIEAVYRFPLSEGAAVCGFRARIGERIVAGEIEDRDKAFEKYDEAMAEGHGAYLLDEERPNIFTVSVGDLRPGDEATVEIDYVELLSTHGGESRFFLPTTISPRYTPAGQPDEEDIPVSERVVPSGGILPRVPYGIEIHVDVHGKETVASVESPSHKIRQEFQEDRISVTLTSGTTKMDRDFVLTVARKEEFQSCAYAFSGEKGTFLQADLAPEDESGKELRQARIFVIDSSGSMMGGSIEQANAALTAVLRGMKDGELFNVFRFGSSFEKIFPDPVPYSKETLEEALRYIGRVKSMGGTEILPALQDACGQKVPEGYSLALLLLTDGQVSNEKEVVDFVGSQGGRLRVFSLGVGRGVNDFFIRGIARSTGGASELVVPGERIEPKALRLYGKLCRGGIGELSLDGTNRGVMVPRRPVAYFGDAVSIFARLGAGPAPGTITMVGKTVGSDADAWSRILPVKVVPGDNLPVSTLWAREVIRDIEEGVGSSTGSRQQRRKSQGVEGKAAEISREFGVLCATTSFVAVDVRKDGEKARGEAELRKVPAMLTKDWGGIARGVDAYSGHLACIPCMPMINALPDMGSRFRYGVVKPSLGIRERIQASDATTLGTPQHPSRSHRLHSFMEDSSDVKALPIDYAEAPSKSAVSKKGPKKISRTDVLLKILSKQLSGGGFEIDDDLLKAIGMPLSAVRRGEKSFHGPEGDLQGLLIGTALVLAVLEVRFADMVDQWGGLVEKSREWLKEQTAAQDLKVGRKGLMDWARNQASKL